MLFLFILIGLFSSQGASIKNIATAEAVTDDNYPINPTDVFSPDTERIYVTMDVKNAPENSRMSIFWYKGLDESPLNTHSMTISGGNAAHWFGYKPDGRWEEGRYRVEISLNGKILGTVRFKIGEAARAPAGTALTKTFSRPVYGLTPAKHTALLLNLF
jgi:hypothetical protein